MDWETQLIDVKNQPHKVDVYDLDHSETLGVIPSHK